MPARGTANRFSVGWFATFVLVRPSAGPQDEVCVPDRRWASACARDVRVVHVPDCVRRRLVPDEQVTPDVGWGTRVSAFKPGNVYMLLEGTVPLASDAILMGMLC